LDDSTDETISIIDKEAAQLQKENVSITVIRRDERKGYKAGALCSMDCLFARAN
jgi:hypothetical protein